MAKAKAADIQDENKVPELPAVTSVPEMPQVKEPREDDAVANVNNLNGDEGDYAIEQISVKATRDDFAIAALQGMLANGTHMQRADAVAYKAYEYADAMLEARGE